MASTLATIAAIAVLFVVAPVPGSVDTAGTARPDRVAAAMPAVHWTFDGGPDGWRAVFGPGQVRSTVIKEHVKIGGGALESSYTIAPHTYFAIARSVTVPDQPAITLSFWIKSMKTERLGIYLTERDGSGYGYLLALPVGQWKRFVLTSRQFVLDHTSPGNTDENGRLDVGQIAWITIVDFTGLFSPERAPASFYVDDFRIAP